MNGVAVLVCPARASAGEFAASSERTRAEGPALSRRTRVEGVRDDTPDR